MHAFAFRKFHKTMFSLFLALLFLTALMGSAFALDGKGTTSIRQPAICYDENGRQFTGTFDSEKQQYLLGNESLGLYVFSLQGKNYYSGANGVPMYSADNVFGNTPEEREAEYGKGAALLRSLESIRRYYRNAYDVKADPYLVGLYNDTYDSGRNSFATDDILWNGEILPPGTLVGIISIGTEVDPTDTDRLAHEYMHRVEDYETNLVYRGESGSIMEAYADIFGEFVEEGLSGQSPDWVHSGERNLKNPAATSCPAVYRGENYQSAILADNGAVHQNSTVLSHAVYLMWNGIDGNQYRKIDSQTLGRLLLNAMRSFQMTETLPQCASAIYQSARTMGLTRTQRFCVAEALELVGLPVR